MIDRQHDSILRFALLAGVGGTLGTGLRATLTLVVFPGADILTVLIINTVGSFLLGLLVPRAGRRTSVFLGTGVLGGFTTYSALSLTTVQLSTTGSPAAGFFLAAGTVIAGLVAALFGLWCGGSAKTTPGTQPSC